MIELKVGDFDPSYLDSSGMYMAAVDDLLRHADDKPTMCPAGTSRAAGSGRGAGSGRWRIRAAWTGQRGNRLVEPGRLVRAGHLLQRCSDRRVCGRVDERGRCRRTARVSRWTALHVAGGALVTPGSDAGQGRRPSSHLGRI